MSDKVTMYSDATDSGKSADRAAGRYNQILALLLGGIVLLAGVEARAGNTLSVGDSLANDASILSSNGKYKAVLSGSDGNFVVYGTAGKVQWATNVYGGKGWTLSLQADGNLVVYDASKGARWSTDTWEARPGGKYFLKIEDTGELNLYRGTTAAPGGVLWNSQLGRRYKSAKAEDIARTFAPQFRFSKNTLCYGLNFKENLDSATASDMADFSEHCRGSYASDFAVFFSVARPNDDTVANTDGESFRITYGIAFGWQRGALDKDAAKFASNFGDVGAHGEDAQYVVVDVVNGRVTSALADLHKGQYARMRSGLTMIDEHVVAWVGEDFHPFKLTTTTSSVCKSEAEGDHGLSDNVTNDGLRDLCAGTCASARACPYDVWLNWGDPGGEHYQGYGKLIPADTVCAKGAGQSGTYVPWTSDTNLRGMKDYVGCGDFPWKNSYQSKPFYSGAYGLQGCVEGDKSGGLVCNGAHWADGRAWATSSKSSNAYLEGATAGDLSVHYKAGDPFSDLSFATAPTSITIRTGNRVDAVNTTWATIQIQKITNGAPVGMHGGTGGAPQTLGGLSSDPVVQVELCSATKNKKQRTGYIKLVTRSGKSIEGGKGSDDCQTIHPANKILYGFYGRSGDELDVLGTIWGDQPSQQPLRQAR
jgi:hypothetical protein